MQFSEFAAHFNFTPGQAQSIQHLEGPLFISAGAGSGKTFTLTQRVAWAMLPGSGAPSAEGETSFLQSISEALVITFTEKAAAEIKDRIRSTLRAEGMLEEALKVDAAWISTIHGMCARILREHALEIGMDPAFAVLGGTEEEELRSQAIARVLEGAQANAQGPYLGLFETLGATVVADYVGALLTNAARMIGGLDAVDFGPAGTPLDQQARNVLVLAETLPPGAKEHTYAAADALAFNVRDWLAGSQNPEDLADIAQATNLGDFRAKVAADLKAAVKGLRAACRLVPYHEWGSILLALARDVNTAYETSLRESGKIDMAGLIRKTLETFDTFPEIAAQYTQRFKLVMVDEFQDTSQLQVAMIERIAGKAGQRLCTVGDAQQSIYRFQGADVSVYLDHKRAMLAAGATKVELDENFRSHGDVLAFVRRICGQPGYFEEEFLDLQAATAGKDFLGDGPRVEVALTKYARGQSGAAVEAEARYIAERFAQLREAGHAPGSMVVLMGRLTKAAVYAQAMRDAGFACVVTGGSRYFESGHVQLCLDVLDVLANPYNSESLLSVLTSEALPVTSSDLLWLSTNRERETGQPSRQNLARAIVGDTCPEPASPLLQHAHTVLNRAWAKLGRMRPAQLFMDTVAESGWLSRLQAGGIDEQAKAADVLKFARLVEDAQEEAGFDMARVARAMRAMARVTGEKPGALSVENLDAVRIMTVHASKGLEFPIVAVADCYESSSHTSALALYNEGHITYASLQGPGGNADLVPSSAALAQATEASEFRANMLLATKQKEYEEKKRLFYVACTRASAALILGLRTPWSKSSGYPPLVDDILVGLCPGQEDFPQTSCALDYGGCEPLRFARVEVPEIQAEETEETAGSAADCTAQDGESHTLLGMPQLASTPKQIALPVLPDVDTLPLVPLSMRSGFFSYSSLAHGEGAPDVAFRTAGEQELAPAHGKEKGIRSAETTEARQFVALAEIEAGARAAAPDADKATDFGSALHRACEWLALQPTEPTPTAVQEALERAAGEFGVEDTLRLQAAFERWQGSEARMWANSFDIQQPELPFVVERDGGILEGEIDLFCATGKRAGIVDYKTGGNPAETAEQLYEKHLLQAQCYAYAAIQAGFEEVELRFVRVEQPDPTDPTQPQVVTYHFPA